jgi:4-amino-4-deoxy-L-arabinose transferase-like glycosyltransferase
MITSPRAGSVLPNQLAGRYPSAMLARVMVQLRHEWITLLVGLVTVITLVATSRDMGVAWDEPIYMVASESYVAWVQQLFVHPAYALSDQGISDYWEVNHEHPPLDKLASGLVWAGARYIFDDLTAHRLANMLVAGALVALVYRVVAEMYGLAAGLAAAGALVTMPRFFYHAHLAALDVPETAAIFAVIFLFWTIRDRAGFRWTVGLGLVYGLALGTKINALFELPVILLPWALVFDGRRAVFIRLVWMGLIGVAVWLLLWPWLYYQSLSRLVTYIDFLTLDHYQIAQWYLGHMYLPPPWHYPFVMTLAVVPLTLTLLGAIGTLQVVSGGRGQALGWLFILGALIPILLLASGKSQAFDDERLLMPIFPCVAALAGIGFAAVTRGVRQLAQRYGRAAWSVPLVGLLTGMAFIPQLVTAYTYYPHLLSYYSESIAGLRGATHFGLETTYWSETYAAALPYLNANAPRGAMIWVEAHDVMLYYQVHGQLRSDLRIASPHGNEGVFKEINGVVAPIDDADYAVIQFRQSGYFGDMLRWIHSRTPVYSLSYGHIMLMAIYAR